MRIAADTLFTLYSELAKAHGAEGEEMRLFAESLLEADLRNHQTQGLGLAPYMDELFAAGIARFGAAFDVVNDGPTSAVVDGHAGSGHVIAAKAMDLALDKARSGGIAMVTTRNSGDCGMVASYALRAVEQGMIGIAMSTGPLLVAPWGGRSAEFCTNPLSVAVPAGQGDPVVIDMATSAYSMGKVVHAAREGGRLDGPWLVDADGAYTDDPARVVRNPMDRESPMTGALLPAGAKGFGMLLMVEMLSSLLSGERGWHGAEEGGPTQGADTRDRPAYYSQTLIAISVPHFQDPAAFAAAVDRMATTLTAHPPAGGFDAVRLPGGGATARRTDFLANGVEVRPEEWQLARDMADRLGFAHLLAPAGSA